jgi:ribosome-associated toxin RatA of RatAB toxin-antitoxin module
MPVQIIDINMEFRRPVGELFALLSDHEKMGPILGANVKRTLDGGDSPNGLGSVRILSIWPLPDFDETVTAFEKDKIVEYKITRGSPLKNHKGVMQFFPSCSGGSKLHYTIEFESKIPLLGPVVRAVLENSVRRGLKKLQG